MDPKIRSDILEKLLKTGSSKEMFWKSFSIFKVSKKHIKKQIVLLILCTIPSFAIGISKDTVSLFCDISEIILGVVLAIFGIIFTGYAFFQALINDELLLRLIKDVHKDEESGEERSKLQEVNENFVEVMMLNLAAILLTLLLCITVKAIPNDFILFSRNIVNNTVSMVLLEIYFCFIFTIIWETKSFIFNIFQLFNMYAITRVMQIIQEKSDK